MPIYEYRCKECHQVFEEWSKHFEEENVTHPCPVCRGVSTRIMSHTSFALKGNGWYVTDYGSHKSAAKAEQQNTPDSAGEKTSSTTAESPSPAASGTACANCTA